MGGAHHYVAYPGDDDFLNAIQPELEREKQKVMSDREAFVAWLDDLSARGVTLTRDRIAVARMTQLPKLAPGRYELVFAIRDTITGQSVLTRAPFEIR